MSVPEPVPRERPADIAAGFMAGAAMVVSVIGVVERPVRTIPIAILVAIVAAGIGGRHQRLAAFAVAVGAVSFVVGMAIAVATSRPLF